MAIDDLYAPGTRFAVADGAGRRVGGFLHLAPSPAGGGWSLSTMRRGRGTPNGLTEFLVVETLAWAKRRAARPRSSLNFCALADFLAPRARRHAPAPRVPPRAPRGRQRLPARAPALVQPQVPSGVAAALSLRRAADRPAARRARVSARRAAPDAACALAQARAPCHTPSDGPARHAQPRPPVGDRAGDGAARLRLLPRGAQAHRPAARTVGGDAARRPSTTRARRRAASICASCSTSSGRRS